ncbi:MAG: beta-propeller domain-containing protein [Candidatus Bathyarchaeia archaeon]
MSLRKYLSMALIALIVAATAWAAIIVFRADENEKPILLKTFSSKDELASFINAKIRAAVREPLLETFRAMSAEVAPLAPKEVPEYSMTNIQVEGVDETDIVKTDGRIIYVASSNGLISIIKAYPPEEMVVLSKIDAEGSVIGLFIGEGRLIILVEETIEIIPFPEEPGKEGVIAPIPQYFPWRTLVKVFDISAPESPVSVGEVAFEGKYVSSRMISNYVYIVLMYPAWTGNSTILPKWAVNGAWREISPLDVYYSDSVEIPLNYALIAAIDTLDVSRAVVKSVLTGYASCMYMSKSNIYVTFPALNRVLSGGGKTEIYRIAVDGLKIRCEAKGEVPGNVLNQFSMDEYYGYFRVATTVSYFNPLRENMRMENNIYVLEAASLKVVGKIEGLALGERIYAARFMGERCYLVTFKKVDPLFTIDLSDPFNPRVLGALKIPGYSDYLHPYSKNYLIGIGKEAVPAEEENFAWYQGLKISLFNVSDIEDPKEISKIVIGDRGTDSPVLRDHHAFLLDEKRKLLIIPILEAKIFEEDYPDGRPPWAYGRPIFQGAYVFHTSPEDGIIFKGRITHMKGNSINPIYEVKRALYIGEVLYTVSDGKLKANDLNSLSEISEISLE